MQLQAWRGSRRGSPPSFKAPGCPAPCEGPRDRGRGALANQASQPNHTVVIAHSTKGCKALARPLMPATTGNLDTCANYRTRRMPIIEPRHAIHLSDKFGCWNTSHIGGSSHCKLWLSVESVCSLAAPPQRLSRSQASLQSSIVVWLAIRPGRSHGVW